MIDIGTQVIYVPTHAGGDTKHPDCEHGFTTSRDDTHAFCRFFRREGFARGVRDLRTTCNSEHAALADLVEETHTPKETVNALLWELYPCTRDLDIGTP